MCIALFDCWTSSYNCFCRCHILRVVSIILLVFSMFFTFVFNKKANILVSTFKNLFLLLLASKSSSISSCTDSSRLLKKSKASSVCWYPCFLALFNLICVFANSSGWHFQRPHIYCLFFLALFFFNQNLYTFFLRIKKIFFFKVDFFQRKHRKRKLEKLFKKIIYKHFCPDSKVLIEFYFKV